MWSLSAVHLVSPGSILLAMEALAFCVPSVRAICADRNRRKQITVGRGLLVVAVRQFSYWRLPEGECGLLRSPCHWRRMSQDPPEFRVEWRV